MPKSRKRNNPPPKKKKLQEELEEEPEELGSGDEARAILDERRFTEKGKRVTKYLVDWAGVSEETGEPFSPDWIVAEHIGDGLLDAWRKEKKERAARRKRAAAEARTQSPTPKSRNKRRREESVPVESAPSPTPISVTTGKRRRKEVDIVVALPSKPCHLNPDDYDIVALSQVVSQTTIPDSQENLDSFPSAAATVGDRDTNLELRSPRLSDSTTLSRSGSVSSQSRFSTPEEQPEPVEDGADVGHSPGVEQQEPQANPEPPLSAPEASEELVGTSKELGEVSEEHIEVSEERAETSRLSFGERQVVTASNSQQSLELPPDISAVESPSAASAAVQEASPSDGFFTQPELDPDSQPLEVTSPSATAQGASQVVSDSIRKSVDRIHSHQTTTQDCEDTLSINPHLAQIVQPLSSIPDELRTPSQRDTFLNERVIPASSFGQGQEATSVAEAGRSRSVPSDAIVTETPARRALSTPGVASSAQPSQVPGEVTIGASQALEPYLLRAVPEGIADTTRILTVDIAAEDQVGPDPAINHSHSRQISPGPQLTTSVLTTAPSTPTSRHRPVATMDTHQGLDPEKQAEIDAAGIDEGNLTSLILQWHTKPTPSRFERDPTPSSQEPSSSHSHAQLSDADQSENDAQAASDHEAHPSLVDGSHFVNPLGLQEAPASTMQTDEYHLPATIAPSQLEMFVTDSSLHHTLPDAAQPLYQSHDVEHEEVLPGIESRQASATPDVDSERESSRSSSVARSVEDRPLYTVILPMLASTREPYKEAIRSNQSPMKELADYFLSESAPAPDDDLVAEVDEVFRLLHDHCDLPTFNDSIPPLRADAMMKHSTGTNSKYSFVYELFLLLRDSAKSVLVVSRPGAPADNLKVICHVGKFYYTELGDYDRMDDDASDGLTVILSTVDSLSSDLPRLDAVILFDSAARDAWQLHGTQCPAITLSLVVANSIEHIDTALAEPKGSLERRAAMGFALAASLQTVSSPAKMPAPHDLAAIFAHAINDPSSEPDYVPLSLPGSFLDSYLSSPSQRTEAISLVNGRKRVLDGADDRLSTPSKRARTAGPSWAKDSWAMSDLLKTTLSSYVPRPGGSTQSIELPVDQLEWMAAKIAHLENEMEVKNRTEQRLREVVKRSEGEVKSFRKTVNVFEPKFKQAISDRGIFESQAVAAKEKLAKVQEAFAKSKAEAEALRQQLSLKPSDIQSKLSEALAKIQSLEKKLAASSNDLEYFRDRIQSSSNHEAELRSENETLKERIALLESKTSDSLKHIHKINHDIALKETSDMISDQKATIEALQQHASRLEGTLHDLKANRRDTRSGSVPRSPRPGGVMSPRTTTRGGAGPGSRGTSPAAVLQGQLEGSSTPGSVAGGTGIGSTGMSFYQPPGSHLKFSHLRE